MKSRSYRLDEYRITDYDGVLLSWEQHAALAEQRSGRCFVAGDVLVIGECRSRENGYLSGEFFDRLRDLPAWTRTGYYCAVSDLFDTHTAQSLTDDALAKRISVITAAGKAAAPPAAGDYRLGRYRISVNAGSDAYWQRHDDLDGVVSGRCILESAFLFIGPREPGGKDRSRQIFSAELEQLPQLDSIAAWGQSEALRSCGTTEKTGARNVLQRNATHSSVGLTSRPMANGARISSHQYREVISDFLKSAAGRLKLIREQHRAAGTFRQEKTLREHKDVGASPVARTPVGERTTATNGWYYVERVRNFLSAASASLKDVRHAMNPPPRWKKCVVPVIIAILLLGAALSFYAVEHLSESSHHSRDRHHKHHD